MRVENHGGRAGRERRQRVVDSGNTEFVISGIHHGAAGAAHAKGEGAAWMIEGLDADLETVDHTDAGRDHFDRRARRQPIVRHRKERRLEHRLEVHKGAAECGRPDRDRAARPVERCKKRQALHMIPVIVRQQDRNVASAGGDGVADADDSRAGIENEQAIGRLVEDFDARCVAAVADR